MTPEEIGPRLVELVGAGEASVSVGDRYARACVDVPSSHWVAAARSARDDAGLTLTFFDWLSGVDEGEAGFGVVAHLWSVPLRHGVLLRTVVPRDRRRARESGPGLSRRGLARAGDVRDVRHRLRRPPRPEEAAAAARVRGQPAAQGVRAGRPGREGVAGREGAGGERERRTEPPQIRPPGVPDPNEWGPDAGKNPPEPERPARERPARRTPPGDRPARAVPPALAETPPAAEPTAVPEAPAEPVDKPAAEPTAVPEAPAEPVDKPTAEPEGGAR